MTGNDLHRQNEESPQTPGRKNSEKKRRRRRVLTGIFAAVLLLFIAGSALFVKSKLNKINYVPALSPSPVPESAAEEPDPFSEQEDPVDISGLEKVEENIVPEGETRKDESGLNILLLGTDFPFNKNDAGRADAVMILSLDFRDNSARLVSLERAMGVPILSGNYAGKWDWLTHLHHYGGADMMLETLRYCFKLDLERYARVDFAGFQGVINALGGIDIELSEAEAWKLNRAAGWNHLDGEAALWFARLRSIDSDWMRVTRQRRVIQACVNGLRDADLLTLNRLADAVLPLITTNFTQGEILSLMTKLPAFRGVQLEQMTIPAPGTYGGMTVMGGRDSFAPDFEENTRILHEFIYKDK